MVTAGYKGDVEISTDGGSTYYSLRSVITDAEYGFEKNLADIMTWGDDGRKHEQPIGIDFTFSFNGFFEKGNEGLTQLLSAAIKVEDSTCLFRYTVDLADTTRKIMEFVGYPNFTGSPPVQEAQTFSCEVSVIGRSIKFIN